VSGTTTTNIVINALSAGVLGACFTMVVLLAIRDWLEVRP